jgi:hypothetical protein
MMGALEEKPFRARVLAMVAGGHATVRVDGSVPVLDVSGLLDPGALGCYGYRKFSSVMRQLNMYGFSKRGASLCFSHKDARTLSLDAPPALAHACRTGLYSPGAPRTLPFGAARSPKAQKRLQIAPGMPPLLRGRAGVRAPSPPDTGRAWRLLEPALRTPAGLPGAPERSPVLGDVWMSPMAALNPLL